VIGADQPRTISRLLSTLLPDYYDFTRMRLNGNHGGCIITHRKGDVFDQYGQKSAPCATGSRCMATSGSSIDGDQSWAGHQDGLLECHRFHDTEWTRTGAPNTVSGVSNLVAGSASCRSTG
jgi:hypothetical protein